MVSPAPAPAALDRLFDDRADAGRRLAARLGHYAGREALVLAVPCGGVPVGYEVARAVQLPMDTLPANRIPSPDGAGMIGALALGGEPVLNMPAIEAQGIVTAQVNDAVGALRRELVRQECRFRRDRTPPELHHRIVILIDDGVGTGWTIRAAITAVRVRNPAAIIVAAPIVAARAWAELAPEVNEIVCVVAPPLYLSVALWYRDFSQVSDQEVERLLELHAAPLRRIG
jgi:putative phosphoribosyl transferase